jgi:hypothetical protein
MPLAEFSKLTEEQQRQVRAEYIGWTDSDYHDFLFWIRKDGNMASKRSGRHHMTSAAAKRHMDRYGADIRTKGDLKDWKPGHSFTFLKD